MRSNKSPLKRDYANNIHIGFSGYWAEFYISTYQ